MRHLLVCAPGLLVAAFLATACGGDDAASVSCGSGTSKKGNTCVATSGGAGGTAGSSGSGGGGGSGGTGTGTPPTFTGIADLSPASTTALLASWPAATDDSTASDRISYRVYVGAAAGDYGQPTLVTGGGARSALITGLAAGAAQFVRVRAVDGDGNEDANTTELDATPAADTTPPTFGGITGAETGGPGRVDVSWAAATDDATGASGLVYGVWLSQATPVTGLERAPAAISEPGATALSVRTPVGATAYHFVVRARDAAGNWSANTEEQAGTSGADASPPDFGGCTQAEAVSAGAVRVYWKPPSDETAGAADIKIRVYARLAADPFNYLTPAKEFSAGTDGVVDGLSSSSDYYFVCRAADPSGNEDKNELERFARTKQDDVPPDFGGVTAADPVDTTTMKLTWAAANDNETDASLITYKVWVDTDAVIDPLVDTPVQTLVGVTETTVDSLLSGFKYYFLVLAYDEGNNVSTNTAAVSGALKVSFAANVQPIFSANCSAAACHIGPNCAQGQCLEPGVAYINIVNEMSQQSPAFMRVLPGNKEDSYLYMKLTADPRAVDGTQQREQMPKGQSALNPLLIDIVGRWIDEGAENN